VTELWITPLCLLEFGNALQLSVFRRVMTSAEARLAGSALDDDIAAGLMNLAPFPVPAWEEARHISMAHTRTIGARSLDILQVAAALTLGAPLFLTFDRVQRKLAALVGLRTHGSSLRNVIST
jgi:hypothetical protein